MNVEELEQSIRDCNLESLAAGAGIRPEHGPADRLALCQALFGKVRSPEYLDRLEDMTAILAECPRSAEGTRGLAARLRAETRRSFGPLAVEPLDPADLLTGFFKRAVQRRMAGEPAWQDRPPPPDEHFMALIQDLLETVLPTMSVDRAQIGKRARWGGLKSCRRCKGEGLIPCSVCGGRGIVDQDAIQRIFDRLPPPKQQEVLHLQEAEKLTTLALRRIMGRQVECRACDGERGKPCSCALYIEVPKGVRAGWIVRIENAKGEAVSHRRVDSIT